MIAPRRKNGMMGPKYSIVDSENLTQLRPFPPGQDHPTLRMQAPHIAGIGLCAPVQDFRANGVAQPDRR